MKGFRPLGKASSDIIDRIDAHSASNYTPYPFVVKRAEGPWLFDPDGNKALDMLSAYSAILSHKHPKVIEAVRHEMESGSDLVSRAIYSSRYADFVESLTGVTGYDRVLPKSDGGSATDSAIAGMLMHGHDRGIAHPEVILTEDYFHGRTWIYASNAHFDPDQSHRKIPRTPGIKVVRDDPQAVRSAVSKNTVGIFVETHKGEGGPIFSTKDSFMAMREIASDNDLIFGCDEIQTGLGRCGHMMAWQEYGDTARPDFVTLGKALGGGIIPVSAVVGTEEFMKIYTPGSDGSTFGGYPLACAAALASLKAIKDENICERSLELGSYLADGLGGIDNISLDHRGLLMRVELKGLDSAKEACYEMLLGDHKPRVFMKYGHHDEKRDVAFTRIAPPPGAITKGLIDDALKNTIIPVLSSYR